MKYFLCITLQLILYTVGIFLFTRGFLLTRVALSANSTCDDQAGKSATPTERLCPGKPRFRRAVLIVIDALRFDFVADEKESICDGDICAGGQRLQILAEIARDRPFNSRLYRFVADPPTTTLQRLKGLTTGSLPTFVDAGANFASTEITEDNFIDQYLHLGRNITFMGDDTWQALFPGRFARSFPFPSFNVKDLDTVDNGVIEHLEKELLRPDWQLLIAHFLGVDHCGHTFGPQHPKMTEKLKQMDSVLRAVISQLDNDTVLFVLGDHGMTSTGDHGGDSFDELDATLFVYSSSVISETLPRQNEYTVVSQVDFVPTVSLMLGIPVPFSNLGTVIVDMFDYDPLRTNNTLTHMYQKLTALQLNAQQVQRFLHKYGEQSNDLPQFELNKLDEDFSLAESDAEALLSEISLSRNVSEQTLAELTDRYIDYLGQVRGLCRSVWSKFDLVTMAVGGAVIICAFVFNIILAVSETNSTQLSAIVFVAVSVVGLSGMSNLLQLLPHSPTLIFTVLAIAFFFITIFTSIRKYFVGRLSLSTCHFQFLDIFSILLCCVHSVSLLSNSFVVCEDRSTSFFVQSLLILILVVHTCCTFSTTDPGAKRRIPKEFPWTSLRIVLLVLLLAGCVRLSAVFRSCREEQVDCQISWFAQPLSAILTKFEHFRLARLSVSVVSVVVVIVIVTMWLRHCGNLNGLEPSVVAIRYIIPLMGICLCVYWLVDGFLLHNSSSRIAVAGISALPRLVYVLSLAVIIVVAVSPLCVLVLYPQRDCIAEEDSIHQLQNASHQQLIAQIYGHVRRNWRSVLKSPDASHPSENTPVVYGLATVYSSGHIVLLTAVAMVMMLVLGDNMAPSIALWVVTEITLLELHAAYVHCRSDDSDGISVGISWTTISLVSLLASQQFFATGHQATIAGIQWTAAFHGFREDHTTVWLPGLLVSLNTFASHILSTLSLPLLIYWPFTRGRWVANQHGKPTNQDRGEFQLNIKAAEEVKRQVFLLIVRFILLSAIKMLMVTVCVTVHRRHLMVWKIFAPRYVYECAAFLVVLTCCVFTYLFVSRLNSCLTKWVQVLCTTS